MDFPGEKLVVRLWDTLAVNGISTLLEPWKIKREGVARAELRRLEMLSLAQSEIDAESIKSGQKKFEDFSPTLRIGNSFSGETSSHRVEPTLNIASIIDETCRQVAGDNVMRNINISKAVIYAEESLNRSSSKVSGKDIEKDWMYRWKNLVGEVSSEEMHRLWGRLLAEEIEQPGTFSMRCLDFIKNLSQHEAKLVELISTVSFNDIVWGDLDVLEASGVTFDQLMELQDLGILSGVEAEDLSTTFGSVDKSDKPYRTFFVISNEKALVVKAASNESELVVTSFMVTRLGQQLLTLSGAEANLEYYHLLAKDIVKQGYAVYMADYVADENESYAFTNYVRL
ncbi:hypothetical protein CCX46_08865 [Pseudomonas sp. RU47]|uniref:DUF2806 domain-containing protein n=1 Tax=Pseudomonas sp. RU47 TaxID=2005388 RepID=UPI000FDD3DD3|nr:DUF2806 domain-containing protein [Pseudomonas sp. RU47]AZZ75255.1 hypothetical protein CCX46_08865 [Pseudomonas sp. RU47]